MIRYCLGYRYTSGQVEGFIGYGFTTTTARAFAIHDIQLKLDSIGEPFEPASLIETGSDCKTVGERNQLGNDWAAIRKALKERGASIY